MTEQLEELELAPANAPDIATLARADAPAIWDDCRAKLEKLKATAETLTEADAKDKAGLAIVTTTRKAFKALRVEVEHRRTELGEEALRRKQKIDTAARELVALIKPFEERMLALEQAEERAEAKRVADLKECRDAALSDYGFNPASVNSGTMADEEFDTLLCGLQSAKLKKIADEKAEAEARAAKEKADAEERERQQVENERLKAEAAEREAALAKEREEREKERAEAEVARLEIERKADAARKEAEAQARAEREEIERAAEQERQRLAAEHKAAMEKIAKERAAADLKARKEREAAAEQARKDREAREEAEAEVRRRNEAIEAQLAAEKAEREKAAKAPDREKLMAFASNLRALEFPNLTTPEGKAVIEELISQAGKFAAWVEKKAGAL